jgi:GcrA cell cycle regulator
MSKKLKSLIELQARDCRWPIGDPRDAGFHFCGAPQSGSSSYCELHWRASFDESKSRVRAVGGTSTTPIRRAA